MTKGKKFGFEPYQHLIARPEDTAVAIRATTTGGRDE